MSEKLARVKESGSGTGEEWTLLATYTDTLSTTAVEHYNQVSLSLSGYKKIAVKLEKDSEDHSLACNFMFVDANNQHLYTSFVYHNSSKQPTCFASFMGYTQGNASNKRMNGYILSGFWSDSTTIKAKIYGIK